MLGVLRFAAVCGVLGGPKKDLTLPVEASELLGDSDTLALPVDWRLLSTECRLSVCFAECFVSSGK